MAHQYPRSERQLVLEDLEALIRDGCLPGDRLSLFEHWLPDAGNPAHFSIPFFVTKIPVRPLIENGLLGLMDAAETKGLHFLTCLPPPSSSSVLATPANFVLSKVTGTAQDGPRS